MERTQSVQQLIQDIVHGKVVLPEFQRDFVWEITKTYDLFDSIVKDIFVGAIIYGIPSFEIAVREIDKRPKAQRGKRRPPVSVLTVTKDEIARKQALDRGAFRLLLDGQQRSTALYRAVMGVDPVWFIAKNEGELEREFEKAGVEELLYEFSGSQDSERLSILLSDAWKMDEGDLDDEDVKEFFKKGSYFQKFSADGEFDEKAEFRKFRYLKKKIAELFKQEKLLSYYLLDMSLEKFVIFFERSNTRGVQLNFIDILSAKLYTGNFNLKQKIQEFQSQNPNHHLIPETIVRAIAYLKSGGKEVDRNFILTKLKAEDFVTLWDPLCKAYRVTLDFLYENNLIISQDWMPYENMLIPLMIFVGELGGDYHAMSQNQKEFLVFWYWNSIFSLRYSGSTNERIIEDATIFVNVAQNKKIASPAFFNKLTKSQVSEPDDIYSLEKKGNAVYKGVLNLINYHSAGLSDWNNDGKLSLNSELEDHHIFPRAYLDKTLANDLERDFIDCVGNRTLVPKKLNIKISAQKPSEYLNEINNRNTLFEKTLENHLIPKEILSGDFDEEYKYFLDFRIDEIFRIVQKHLMEPAANIRAAFLEEPKVEELSNIPVFGRYKGNTATGTFNPSTGRVILMGTVYTPSAAASVIKTQFGASPDNTENGWTFWRFLDDNGEERKILELRAGEAAVKDPAESVTEPLGESDDSESANESRADTASAAIRRKRDMILQKFAEREGVELIRQRRSPATFASENGEIRVACTISSPYEDTSYPYWFRYDVRWRDFINEANKGFLILGCTDLDSAFVLPSSEMEKILSQLNTTDQYRDRENYWHIFIREKSGHYGIVLSKTSGFFELSRFAISVKA